MSNFAKLALAAPFVALIATPAAAQDQAGDRVNTQRNESLKLKMSSKNVVPFSILAFHTNGEKGPFHTHSTCSRCYIDIITVIERVVFFLSI